MASDGAQVYGESRNSWGDLNAQFGVVFPQAGDRSTELAILQGDRSGNITPHLSYIGRLIYEYDGGRVRLAVSGAQVNTGYDAAQRDPFSGLGTFQFTPIIFSAQYNTERWSLTSEYAIRHLERHDFGAVRNLNVTGESYYFQGIYRFLQVGKVYCAMMLIMSIVMTETGKISLEAYQQVFKTIILRIVGSPKTSR